MPVQISAPQPEGERLISIGGNIYSLRSEPVKVGMATRGRGYWTGVKDPDDTDLDVDNPSPLGAQDHSPIDEEETSDGFDDDDEPMTAFMNKRGIKRVTEAQLQQAREIMEAAAGFPVAKAVLTVGSVNVDLLLQDPERLTEEELIKSAYLVKQMYPSSNKSEQLTLAEYAKRLSGALLSTIRAREVLSRAILTKPSEEREKPSKKAPKGPRKASDVQVNAKGKVAYKYPAVGDKKGPRSDGWKGAKGSTPDKGQKPAQEAPRGQNGAPQEGNEAPQEVTPPPSSPVNPKILSAILGVKDGQLLKFAHKKTKEQFVQFFMGKADLVRKNKLSPAMLGKIYDSIISPVPPQAQPDQPKAGGGASAMSPHPPVKGLSLMGKSLVVFNGASLSGNVRLLWDLLKSQRAETVEDIRRCLKGHYKCSDRESVSTTRTLLNRWERQGHITIYPKE